VKYSESEHPLSTWCWQQRISLAAFARRLGVARGTLNNWVHGHRPIATERAREIETLTDGAVPVEAWLKRRT